MIKDVARKHDEAFAKIRRESSKWNLGTELIDELLDRHIAVTFAAGSIVFSEGSSADVLACILSGFVKVYCPLEDGNRTLMRVAGPGELLGHGDLVDERGRRSRLFEAQALTKTTIALVTREHVARLLRAQDTEALIGFIESLNTIWSSSTRWFATLLGLPFQRRLEMVFDTLAVSAGVSDNQGTVLIPELCHEDLAEMIGCSRPMVSRLIRDMIDAGVIARRGKQYVLLNKGDGSSISRFLNEPAHQQPATARSAPIAK